MSNEIQFDDKENFSVNPSDNTPFETILERYASRRNVVAGGLTLAATTFFSTNSLAGGLLDELDKKDQGARNCKGHASKSDVSFSPVPNAVGELDNVMPSISDDYQYQVLIPWGTPIEPGCVTEYTGDPSTRPTAEEAAKQIGIGHDGMWFFPYRRSNSKGLLAINHEYGGNQHVLGKDAPESLEDVKTSQNVHGVSIVALKKNRDGQWENHKSSKARRITVNSPMTFSGPVANSPLLENAAGNEALGTVNNCGSGATPWGTYLTCEENFNGYFGSSLGEGFEEMLTEEQARYGFASDGFGYGWHHFDRRFDLSDADYANEQNRFGWIVEIDPFNPKQTPVKRTALGRFKHEAVAVTIGKQGKAVAYMGDDQRFDYIYKFVSDRNHRKMLREGVSPLDEGKLYVARFNDDGTGDWLELTIDNPILAERFSSQAEVLVYARIAADLLGATPMDRPEWTTIGQEGYVYCTLTNNSRRTEPNAANPETPNSTGHIIRWKDSDNYVGETFNWEIYLLASATQGTEETFGSPDALWADKYGRLFIGTDGGQEFGLQDQLLVIDTKTGTSRRLLTGVNSDEVTGITITPDQRTMFVNLQHPGNGNPESTNFPVDYDGVTIPRDCTLVITKKDGGIIGS